MYTPSIADWLVESTLAFLSHKLGTPVERYMYGLELSLPARALNMEFLKSMTWDEVIHIEISLKKLGFRSLKVSVTGKNSSGDKTFTGHLTMVSMSPAEGHAVAIPPELRLALEQKGKSL
jgi:acyl-CoA thioesterase FadM